MKLPCLYRVARLKISFSTDFQLRSFTERHYQHVLCAVRVYKTSAQTHTHVLKDRQKEQEERKDAVVLILSTSYLSFLFLIFLGEISGSFKLH